MVLGFKKLRDPYYQGFAAQLSFYYILSLVPILLLLTQLLGAIFKTSVEEAIGWILSVIGGDFEEQVVSLLSFKSAGVTNVVYVLIMLWAASRAQFALTRICNFTYTDGETTGNSFLRERLRAVLTMALQLLAMMVAVVILVYGGQVIEIFFSSAGIWLWVRWPFAFLMFFLVIWVTYRILPSQSTTWRYVIPGSLFASVGLLLVTVGYNQYLNSVAQYDILYGTLANIAALMFWFYVVSWVIGLGVVFNKVWWDTSEDTQGDPYRF